MAGDDPAIAEILTFIKDGKHRPLVPAGRQRQPALSMTAPAPELSSPVGLIAAGGVMPFAVADSLSRRGLTPVLFAIRGACDEKAGRALPPSLDIGRPARPRHEPVPQRGLPRPHVHRCAGAAVAVRDPPRLGTLRVIGKIWTAFRGGDDHLLSGIGRILEGQGFRMVGIKDVAPDLLMPEGCVTGITPDPQALADIAKGRDVLRALSPFDIGQAAVVIDGHVVGVEDIEGTDGLLARIAQLRAQGRIRAAAGRGVLVKAPKTGQDLRYRPADDRPAHRRGCGGGRSLPASP